MRNEILELLLIEEDEVLAEITAFRLELLGYGVRCAHSGEEARTMLADRLPDLIILDLYLPDVQGVDLVNALKNDPETHSIPILVFSIDADLENVERAYLAGAEDFLVTPYDPAVLEQKLSIMLQMAE